LQGMPNTRSISFLLKYSCLDESIAIVCVTGSTLLISQTANLRFICFNAGNKRIPSNPIDLTTSRFCASNDESTSCNCLMDDLDEATHMSVVLVFFILPLPLLGSSSCPGKSCNDRCRVSKFIICLVWLVIFFYFISDLVFLSLCLLDCIC